MHCIEFKYYIFPIHLYVSVTICTLYLTPADCLLRRKIFRFSQFHGSVLNSIFAIKRDPPDDYERKLADAMGVPPEKVHSWFKSTRYRYRKRTYNVENAFGK